ncbi:hypothetical protein C5E02_12675 [Rathayibacter rathayi]|uniref:hypothetical protein n=1 Tax=Rathayibacter rathayi TaxID=33887 RepID=UPI000CE7B273|nr:hypothetical protein [Rathayibacter rathayi]PPG11392.1 hypothetical protein C5C11_12690 [Rathayibacter rathayi]PPG37291.1 hypothetical protein C5C20_14130 [Rathayibacter rathayi]PPI59014.1 hypothetical protein C5E02_12675 [Rathayibacter rathayi]
MPKKTRDVIVASSDWTVPSEDGLHRRTIVKGAAWTVPVVAVSMATPAAAASKTPTLAFTAGSYSGTACKTITGVKVKRTTDGTTADAGQTVTVTLKDGYKFKDGTTTYSATTGTDGTITLPDITVPAKGGDSTFNATSGTLSASATVTADKKTVAGTNQSTGTNTEFPNVPSNATAVGGNYFLAPNGDLYYENGTKPVATDVKSAVGYLANGTQYASYVTNAGVAGNNKSGGSNTTFSNVPSGSTPVGGNFFLSSAGGLYYENGTTAVLTGIKSAKGYLSANGTHYVSYVTTAGEAGNLKAGGTAVPFPNVPSGSTPVGGNFFLSSAGGLYYENGKTALVEGVKSASGYLNQNDAHFASYVTTAGVAANTTSAGKSTTFPNVPSGSTPVGGNYFLSTDGGLYYENGTTAKATGVTSASGYLSSTSVHYSAYVQDATKC